MTLKPVTKLDKKTWQRQKKFNDDFISPNCDVIVIFTVDGQFGTMICKA